MRLAWLAVWLLVTGVAGFVVLGGVEQLRMSAEARAVGGILLGIALSTVTTNVNALIADRETKHKAKLSTLGDQLELAVELGVVHAALVHISAEQLTEALRSSLSELVKGSADKAQSIGTRLAEKHPRRNLIAQHLKLELLTLSQRLMTATTEELTSDLQKCSKTLRRLDAS